MEPNHPKRGGSAPSSPRSGRSSPVENLQPETYANFGARQGPVGAPRESDNMSAEAEQQIRNAFAIHRAQRGAVLGVTIPIPASPHASPHGSPNLSPNFSPNLSPRNSPRASSSVFPPPHGGKDGGK